MTDYDAAGYTRRFAAARTLTPVASRTWTSALRAAARRRTMNVVLDLGAGSGRFEPVIRDAWRPASVVAVDRSSAMLRRFDRSSTTSLICADMAAVPFATGSFDACFSSMVLHYSREPREVCGDIRRVLRPGGLLCVRTGTQETIASFGFLKYFPRARAAERVAMPREDQVVAWLRDAGFTEVHVQRVSVIPADGWWSYLRKVLTRGFPSMQLMPWFDFAAGSVPFILSTVAAAARRRPIPAEQTMLITAVAP